MDWVRYLWSCRLSTWEKIQYISRIVGKSLGDNVHLFVFWWLDDLQIVGSVLTAIKCTISNFKVRTILGIVFLTFCQLFGKRRQATGISCQNSFILSWHWLYKSLELYWCHEHHSSKRYYLSWCFIWWRLWKLRCWIGLRADDCQSLSSSLNTQCFLRLCGCRRSHPGRDHSQLKRNVG